MIAEIAIDHFSELTGIEDIVEHYLKYHAPTLENTLAQFATAQTLLQVIQRACASIIEDNGKLKLHPHQWRPFHIWPQASDDAVRRLIPSINDIEGAHDFDGDLFPTISKALAEVKGIGSLACYDFALRIGAWFRPKLEPTEYVYLHRGAKKGAEAIGIQANNRARVPIDEFPARLHQLLTPAQIEDALCIYHGTLYRLAGSDKIRLISDGSRACRGGSARRRAYRPGCG